MKLNNILHQEIKKLLRFQIRGGTISTLTKGKISTTKILCYLQRREPFWDPWILKDGDIYRLFYLVGSKSEYPWFKVSAIHGAISSNMKQWKNTGVVLEPEPTISWESGRICAGSTRKENNVYYLFYSASSKKNFWDESIGLATSVDGLHWQRHSTHPFLKPDDFNPWYGSSIQLEPGGSISQHFQWRDPYIVKDYRTGHYYMFISASSKERENSQFSGCVGLAVAKDIIGPYKLLPPAAAPVVEGTNESPFYEMERPQVIYKDGKYHLFFSCWPLGLNPKWIQEVGKEKLTNSSLYWYISDDITGPFKPVNKKPIVTGSDKTGMYGTNFFSTEIGTEELTALGWYPRWMTIATSPRFRVYWNKNSIKVE